MNHNHRPPQVPGCPAPEQVTNAHIQNISILIETLKDFILPPPRDPQSSIPTEPQRLDGESAIAATTTFIKACSRLDALLDDADRWTLKPHKELYAAINSNYLQQFEFLKAQTMAANNLSRPFFLLKPDLVQIDDGSFVAYWGDIGTPGAGLVGRGKTPAEAFADFDQAYFRQEQIRLERPPSKPPVRKPKKK